MMGDRLANKRALVTGAGSGIGRSTAIRFAVEGATVALVDVNREHVEGVAAEITALGGRASALVADVCVEEEIAAAVESGEQQLSGLDVVVANAAVSPGHLEGGLARVDELDAAVWRHIVDVNLTGAFLTCKHAVRALLRSGGGSLICTGSPTGLRGMSQSAYSASKAGVMGLMRVIAYEYADDGIRANSVVPGFTDTPFVAELNANRPARDAVVARVPLKRAAHPDEIASMMLFLASDESSYATGALFVVDGGRTAV